MASVRRALGGEHHVLMKRSRWALPIAAASAVAAVAAHDVVQREHALLRNFPVVGRARRLLESVGPELRQYIVAGNNEERPFTRDQRRWVYASAKEENNYFGLGIDKDAVHRRLPDHQAQDVRCSGSAVLSDGSPGGGPPLREGAGGPSGAPPRFPAAVGSVDDMHDAIRYGPGRHCHPTRRGPCAQLRGPTPYFPRGAAPVRPSVHAGGGWGWLAGAVCRLRRGPLSRRALLAGMLQPGPLSSHRRPHSRHSPRRSKGR